ncbi:MAG: hypothetical protein Q9M36_13775 [Sulfurovum sp.]|nr:hypothetical protein [Sulfurovum sp.]
MDFIGLDFGVHFIMMPSEKLPPKQTLTNRPQATATIAMTESKPSLTQIIKKKNLSIML